MGSTSSYVIGSSYSLADLTDDDRAVLDSAPWVFTCNSFLSHWEHAGFRPTVWAFGDNHSQEMVSHLDVELAVWAEDVRIQKRLQFGFAAVEEWPEKVEAAARAWCVPLRTYRRQAPWTTHQQPARSLEDTIFHQGSTLTNLINFAWLLNPGGEIRLYGNEWGDGFGHFWEGKQNRVRGEGLNFWREVKGYMWAGIRCLQTTHGLPIVDCNRHLEPLPEDLRIPIGTLCGP